MSEKHSPLPWAHRTGLENEIISDADEEIVCRMPNHPENGKFWHLDAPLIVRSVNLLPELVKALEEIEATKDNGPDWSMAKKCQRIAAAALAKARA